jgi:cell surface hyaluronidase
MNSYIKGNTFHRSYNRALTIHAVQYLRVIGNVAYDVMGHTFFVEDAIETKNFLDGNLAILTKRSWSILNTDQTPACFWITNPDNIIRNNHAVGADRYGFWFDLQPTSTGPSYSPNVCPINTQLGEFDGNVAHSHGRYGLRIFHGHVPRTYPCSPIVYDSTNPTDPYHANPIVTAEYTNYLGYSNNDNGAIAERVGDVRFTNFKVADNIMTGIEFSIAGEVMDGMT